jgi:3D (Asp-Asp-Asp) domain-containing protein
MSISLRVVLPSLHRSISVKNGFSHFTCNLCAQKRSAGILVRADVKILGCRKMIELIMKTLNSIPIVSVKNIVDLKHYLAANYPELDAGTLQQFVVEFIGKTLDSCLSYFSAECRLPLRQLILNNTRKINIFEVYASDILKAALQLSSEYPTLRREIANWAGEFQVDAVAKETVVNYILNHCHGKAKLGNLSLRPEGKGLPLQSQLREQSLRLERKGLPQHSPPAPTSMFQADPYAQTVVLKLAPAQPKPSMEEIQLATKWINPYVNPESSDSKRHTPAKKRKYRSAGHNSFAAWFKKYQKLFIQKLRNLIKTRNMCIAAVVLFILLVGCPRIIICKTKMDPSASVTDKVKAVAAQTGLNSVAPQAPNTETITALNHSSQLENVSQGTRRNSIKRLTMPIIDAPNTIIVGYIKEKTASGLVEVPIRRYFERKMRLKASAYDLSLASCGKDLSHPEYGITRTGTRARRGRTIAVDPRVIPLGRKVYIVFPKKYRHMNGIYVAEDTGTKIKGYRVDIFWGEDGEGKKQIRKEACSFGRRKVEIYLLQD